MSRYANASAGAVEREGACRGVRGMVKDTRSAHLRASLRAEEAGGPLALRCQDGHASSARAGPQAKPGRAPEKKSIHFWRRSPPGPFFGTRAPAFTYPFLEQEPPLPSY